MLRYVLFLAFFSYWAYTLFRRFMYSMKLFLPDTHGIIHKNEPFWLLHSLDFPSFFFQTIQVERT